MDIPVESTKYVDGQSMTAKPGRKWAIGSLVCAALALAFAPVALGPLGIVAGTVAVSKGVSRWGTVGVTASAVAGVVGFNVAAGPIA